jgi:hypothetical protein
MRRRIVVAVVAVVSMLFVGSYAVPATGVPSLGKVYRVAKKALRTAKKAKRGPRVVERAREDIPAAPLDFAEFDVKCPAGYTAVGIGLGLGPLQPVFFASYGGGALGSMANPSSTTVYTGDAFVECVKSAGYTSASVPRMTKSKALRELREAEAEVRAAR